ncbi:MAG TPA: LysR substrate-binding domain-containing protein, partial [Burkholderiales bacterium]
LVCRDDHPLARKKSLAWKALEPHAVILPGHESGNRPHLDMALERHKVKLHAFYEVQRSSTAVGMVAKGVGVAVVPALAVQADAYPGLKMIPLVDPVVSRNIVLLSRTKAQLTPAAQALYDLIRKQAI